MQAAEPDLDKEINSFLDQKPFFDYSIVATSKQCWGSGSECFWAIRIRILPFSHNDVERSERLLEKYNFNTKF
jgi:hypothetical protein